MNEQIKDWLSVRKAFRHLYDKPSTPPKELSKDQSSQSEGLSIRANIQFIGDANFPQVHIIFKCIDYQKFANTVPMVKKIILQRRTFWDCSSCQMRFSRKWVCGKHERLRHSNIKKPKLQLINKHGYACLICKKMKDYKTNDMLFLHLYYFHRHNSEKELWKYDIDRDLLQVIKPWAKNSLHKYEILRRAIVEMWNEEPVKINFKNQLQILNPVWEKKCLRNSRDRYLKEIEACAKQLEMWLKNMSQSQKRNWKRRLRKRRKVNYRE